MFRKKYLIEVNYKSGIQKRWWVYSFNFQTKEGEIISAEWESVSEIDRPLVLNVNEIESAWKVRESRHWV